LVSGRGPRGQHPLEERYATDEAEDGGDDADDGALLDDDAEHGSHGEAEGAHGGVLAPPFFDGDAVALNAIRSARIKTAPAVTIRKLRN
jgi:hypothetical protein